MTFKSVIVDGENMNAQLCEELYDLAADLADSGGVSWDDELESGVAQSFARAYIKACRRAHGLLVGRIIKK